MSSVFTIRVIEILFSIAFLIQTLEYISMRSHLSESGILSWKNLNGEYRGWTLKLLNFLFQSKMFLILLVLRLVVSMTLILHGDFLLCIIAFASHILVLLRFKGNFNGGSDFMITQVLVGLFFFYALPGSLSEFGLWYIAVQLLNSYFIAGVIKIKNPDWRSGQAVMGFLQNTTYCLKPNIEFLVNRPNLVLFCSWAVMAWEISFPLSLFNLHLALILLFIGFIFHLGNWVAFGLNRFVFSWVATYPALIYCVMKLKA